MIRDKSLIFSEAQAITVDAASTNIIDLGQAENLGLGQDLTFVAEVTVVAGAGTEGLQLKLQSDDNADFTSPKDEIVSGVLLPAVLTAGARFQFKLPANTLQQYIRGYYEIVSTSFTGLKMNLFITQGAIQQ